MRGLPSFSRAARTPGYARLPAETECTCVRVQLRRAASASGAGDAVSVAGDTGPADHVCVCNTTMSERDELERVRLQIQEEKARRKTAAADRRRLDKESRQLAHRHSAEIHRRIASEAASAEDQQRAFQSTRAEVARVAAANKAVERQRAEERAHAAEEAQQVAKARSFAEVRRRHEATVARERAQAKLAEDRAHQAEAFRQQAIKEEVDRQERLRIEHEEDMAQAVRELSQIEDDKQVRERRASRGWQPSSWGRNRARTPRQPRVSASTPTKHINPAIMAKLQVMNLQHGVSTESG